ncbi:MAG: tetratricopeptide repeat protein [Alphaproteobacteria bacterium]|nr:tetratricopeptide repeat protein [Alphaproteobacteria bacterium]
MRDALGHEVTTSSRDCVAALDATQESYLGFRVDAAQHVNAALKADPACVMANCLKGCLTMLLSNAGVLGAVDQRIAAAEASAATATKRERLHLVALKAWRVGRNDEALAAWEAILAEHPHDLAALRLAHFSYFWTTGDARRMRSSVERALGRWDPAMPGYGFVLGMQAFACEESGDYVEAERQGLAAIARNPADLWAIHAVAHVMEMQARHGEGASWVEAHRAATAEATNFKFHLAWHRALFLLEGGRIGDVLDAYDREVRDLGSPLVAGQPDLYIDVQNAAALLMRLELLDVPVGDRWTELADKAEKRIGDHVVLFTVPHWMMALAAAERWAKTDELLAAMRDHAARSGASEADVVARVAIPAAECVRAHRRREWDRALSSLFPVRHEIVRLGGSHAQRDILWQVMADAAAHGGHMRELRQLVDEVTRSRPPRSLPTLYRRAGQLLAT